MKPRRRTGLAAEETTAERAGTIASSRGNARVTPIPRRKVRLGSAILVININQLLCAFRRLYEKYRADAGRYCAGDTFADATVVPVSTLRIWKGVLLTMPMMRDCMP